MSSERVKPSDEERSLRWARVYNGPIEGRKMEGKERVSVKRWHTSTASWIVAIALALSGRPDAVILAQAPTKIAVTGQKFVANLYLPSCDSKCPVVLLVGGSGGEIWDYHAESLARRGFAALALAYFSLKKMPELPQELDQIPLEYFQNVLAYVHSHGSLDPERIGIAGVSKGGELALLLASVDPRIRAVLAFVPSSVVWQSLPSSAAWDRAADQQPRRSSWTYKGQPLPFVPYAAATTTDSLADMYRRSLDQRELIERAAIPVEGIKAPILLLSGKQDTTWPSSLMSEMVMTRLRARNFGFPYDHIAYDDAGHMIWGRRTDIPATRRGGTEEGNRVAQDDAERRMLEFFGRHLASAR